jgi:uncharacterized protein (DUF305 family)
MKGNVYRNLLVMSLLSFLSMYVLMYAMVDRFANVYSSFNQAYMAGLMTAPMVLIELLVMRAMYPERRKNALAGAPGVLAGIAFFAFIREQAAISDEQFLRSMIPHHGGAVLMCEQSAITDPEIRALCRRITSSQQSEIDQMKTILSRLNR